MGTRGRGQRRKRWPEGWSQGAAGVHGQVWPNMSTLRAGGTSRRDREIRSVTRPPIPRHLLSCTLPSMTLRQRPPRYRAVPNAPQYPRLVAAAVTALAVTACDRMRAVDTPQPKGDVASPYVHAEVDAGPADAGMQSTAPVPSAIFPAPQPDGETAVPFVPALDAGAPGVKPTASSPALTPAPPQPRLEGAPPPSFDTRHPRPAH